MCATMPAYSVRYVIFIEVCFWGAAELKRTTSFFITLILRGMGWSVTASFLLVRSLNVFAGILIGLAETDLDL